MEAVCSGVILAGGTGSRFAGGAKGLARVGGSRIIDRVAAAVRFAADDIVLIANDPQATTWLPAVSVRADGQPWRGSLAGLRTALLCAGGPALVVAWDMPFVSGPLLRAIRAAGEARGTAVIPEGPRGCEPLCAYYRQDALPVIEAQLVAGDFRVRALASRLPGAWTMPRAEVERFGLTDRLFFNINDVDDLAVADRMVDSMADP